MTTEEQSIQQEEEIVQSKKVDSIFKAIVKFQGMPKDIKKTVENTFFKNKYAPLSEILNAIREPLFECGLAIMQFPQDDDYLLTRIIHESGEFIESRYKMVPNDRKPQTKGSCLTYQKRYAINAILGLDSDNDDDGNEASNVNKGEAVAQGTNEKPWLNTGTKEWRQVVETLEKDPSKLPSVLNYYRMKTENKKTLQKLCQK